MPKKSLVGNIYGDISIIEYIGSKKYKCQCIKCGNISERFSSNLKGELKCKICNPQCRVNLTDNQYGYLKVKSYVGNGKWLCECKCGNTIKVKSNNLKHDNTLSCGKCKYIEAAQRDIVNGTRLSQLNKKVNKNNTSGITGVGYNKKKSKWYASIRFCGKTYWLGYYELKNDAILARKKAEEILHGDFRNWYNEENLNKKQICLQGGAREGFSSKNN